MYRKIKILECIRQGKVGGGESHLLSLAENINRDRFDLVVLSFTEGPMVDRLRKIGIPCHVIYTERPFDWRKWKQVKKFLEKECVDLVHAHGTRAASNILWAARSLNIPVIYTVHGWSFHPDQQHLIRAIRVIGEKYLTARTALNISVSKSNQASGKKFFDSFESTVVNNGIDQKRFDPEHPHKDLRPELHIAENKVVAAFIARFTVQKQPLTLIKAFSQARERCENLHLLMVGEGDQLDEAKKLISQSPYRDDITWLPFRQDVPAILAAADIFVLPSLWEGLPIGLLEAMAMGKAVIASAADGTSEVIAHERNGLLIDTQDLLTNLTHALVELGSNLEKRTRLQEAAVHTINERYNVDHMTRAIEDIYLNLVIKKTLPTA